MLFFYNFNNNQAIPDPHKKLEKEPVSFITQFPGNRTALVSHLGTSNRQEDRTSSQDMTAYLQNLPNEDILDLLALTNARLQRDFGGYDDVGATYRLMLDHKNTVFSLRCGDCLGYCWVTDEKNDDIADTSIPDLNAKLDNLFCPDEIKRLSNPIFPALKTDANGYKRLKTLTASRAIGDNAYLPYGLIHTATILGPFKPTIPANGRLYMMAASDGLSRHLFPTTYKTDARYHKVKDDITALAKDIVSHSVGEIKSEGNPRRKDNTSLAMGYTEAKENTSQVYFSADGHGGSIVAAALQSNVFSILATQATSRSKLNEFAHKDVVKAKIRELINAIDTAEAKGNWNMAEKLRWQMLYFVEHVDQLIESIKESSPDNSSLVSLISTEAVTPEVQVQNFYEKLMVSSEPAWLSWKDQWTNINIKRHLDRLLELKCELIHHSLYEVFAIANKPALKNELTSLAFEIAYFCGLMDKLTKAENQASQNAGNPLEIKTSIEKFTANIIQQKELIQKSLGKIKATFPEIETSLVKLEKNIQTEPSLPKTPRQEYYDDPNPVDSKTNSKGPDGFQRSDTVILSSPEKSTLISHRKRPRSPNPGLSSATLSGTSSSDMSLNNKKAATTIPFCRTEILEGNNSSNSSSSSNINYT